MRIRFFNTITNTYSYMLPGSKLMNLDFGTSKLQGTKAQYYEPQRVVLTIDTDEWVVNNIVQDMSEISQFLLHIDRNLIDDPPEGNLFIGYIDPKKCKPDGKTENITITAYDKLGILAEASDIEVAPLSGNVLDVAEDAFESICGFNCYIEDHINYVNEDLRLEVKAINSNYTAGTNTTYYTGFILLNSPDRELYVVTLSYRLLFTVLGYSKWQITQIIQQYKYFNGYCLELIDESSASETKEGRVEINESFFRTDRINRKYAMLEELNLGSQQFSHSNYTMVVEDASGDDKLVYTGPRFNIMHYGKSEDDFVNVKDCLKAFLLCYGAVLTVEKSYPWNLNAGTRTPLPVFQIPNDLVVDVDYYRADFDAIDTSVLDVLRGDTTTLRNYVLESYSTIYTWEVRIKLDGWIFPSVTPNRSINISQVAHIPDYIPDVLTIFEVTINPITQETIIKAAV